MYFNEKEEKSRKAKNILISNLSGKRCTSLFSTLTISHDNRVISCCGITAMENEYLYLGNADKYDITDLYKYQFDDFIKIWLFTDGPLEVLNFCLKHRNKESFKENLHLCQICALIFKDEENIKILRERYKEVMQRALFEFPILKIKYNKQFKSISHEKD